MNVLCLTVLTVLLCVVYGNDKRQLAGVCVEECSASAANSPLLRSLGMDGCPPGHTCQSNGCGHVCKPSFQLSHDGCSPIMCMMLCVNGFKKDDNGCDVCSCNDLTVG